MRDQHPPIVNVFPGEQNVVLLENALNIFSGEAFADGSAMLVIDHARGLIQHRPPALPRHVSEVGVFQIKRRQQFVEPAQLQKFPPVERA
jgi:hypothetical protein